MHLFDHLTPEVRVALGGILGILVVSSVLVFAVCKFRPQHDHSELVKRTRTWWIIAGLFGTFPLPEWGFLCFLGFVSFLALKEYLSLIPTCRRSPRANFGPIGAFRCSSIGYTCHGTGCSLSSYRCTCFC